MAILPPHPPATLSFSLCASFFSIPMARYRCPEKMREEADQGAGKRAGVKVGEACFNVDLSSQGAWTKTDQAQHV